MTVWSGRSLPLTESFVNRRILLCDRFMAFIWRDFLPKEADGLELAGQTLKPED